MIGATLFRQKHQLWLRFACLSFSVRNPVFKEQLYTFSQIEFRHLKWLAGTLHDAEIAYDYERDTDFSIEGETFFALLLQTILEIRTLHKSYDDSELSRRMMQDETYFLSVLENIMQDDTRDEVLAAFDRRRVWPDSALSSEQTDALTLFLFEELYKEYELILVYFYQQIRCSTHLESSSYQDLIDESHFHLRSFGEMMAKLGILSLPRVLHPRTYVIDDMEKFLINGISEEENAKEECRRLSESISDETLSRFFDFINFQESYHIEIMKKLLKEKRS